MEYALRVEGLPVLEFWGSVLPLYSPCRGRAFVAPEATSKTGDNSSDPYAGGDSQGGRRAGGVLCEDSIDTQH